MHPAAEAYFTASQQRLQAWQDSRLSVEAPPPEPLPEPAPEPKRYRVPLFPPAPLRSWKRPLVKPLKPSAHLPKI